MVGKINISQSNDVAYLVKKKKIVDVIIILCTSVVKPWSPRYIKLHALETSRWVRVPRATALLLAYRTLISLPKSPLSPCSVNNYYLRFEWHILTYDFISMKSENLKKLISILTISGAAFLSSMGGLLLILI